MEFKIGTTILVRHFSSINPFNATIIEVKDNILVLQNSMDFDVINALVGEPVVLVYRFNGEAYISESNISEIDVLRNVISVKNENIQKLNEKRQVERVPTSLNAIVNTGDSKKTIVAIVKNISYNGISFISKEKLVSESEVDFDIYIGNSILHLKVKLIRLTQCLHYFEYGSKIIYSNSNSKSVVESYYRILKKEHEWKV
jgi:hypothetical protein